jgi:hypothetical protein
VQCPRNWQAAAAFFNFLEFPSWKQVSTIYFFERMLAAATLLLLQGCGVSPPKQLTSVIVYRMTPSTIPGLADRDSGDAAGDIFFTLYEAMLPAYCPQNPLDSICTNSVLSNVSRNVYLQSVIEFDPQHLGVYNGCNPECTGSNCSFVCNPYWVVRGKHYGPHETGAANCWWNASSFDNRFFNETFADVCDLSQCNCTALLERSVGVWPRPFSRTTDGPPHNTTAQWKQINAACATLGGNWFSHRHEGECAPGAAPGDASGCFWREQEQLRSVNATCVRRNLVDAIMSRDGGCHAKCLQPKNSSSACWAQCLIDSMSVMSKDELVLPWNRSFASADAKLGGCPEVKTR